MFTDETVCISPLKSCNMANNESGAENIEYLNSLWLLYELHFWCSGIHCQFIKGHWWGIAQNTPTLCLWVFPLLSKKRIFTVLLKPISLEFASYRVLERSGLRIPLKWQTDYSFTRFSKLNLNKQFITTHIMLIRKTWLKWVINAWKPNVVINYTTKKPFITQSPIVQ